MRVITGKAKGRKLKAPKGLDVRPTTDRVKESVFNIIRNIPEDSFVLDLYSGSGNVGIEFLSRGAKECYFIDLSGISIKTIKENLTHTKLSDQAYVYNNDVISAIRILGKKNKKFDFIFMDPPYGKNHVMPTLEEINEQEILNPSGMIIIEHEVQITFPDDLFNFSKIDARIYGSISVTFYRNKEEK